LSFEKYFDQVGSSDRFVDRVDRESPRRIRAGTGVGAGLEEILFTSGTEESSRGALEKYLHASSDAPSPSSKFEIEFDYQSDD